MEQSLSGLERGIVLVKRENCTFNEGVFDVYRSVVKSENLSGKRALYTIHPIEQLEMNELDKRDFSKADVPQEPSAQAQNTQTFMTAMPECELLLLNHFNCY